MGGKLCKEGGCHRQYPYGKEKGRKELPHHRVRSAIGRWKWGAPGRGGGVVVNFCAYDGRLSREIGKKIYRRVGPMLPQKKWRVGHSTPKASRVLNK